MECNRAAKSEGSGMNKRKGREASLGRSSLFIAPSQGRVIDFLKRRKWELALCRTIVGLSCALSIIGVFGWFKMFSVRTCYIRLK